MKRALLILISIFLFTAGPYAAFASDISEANYTSTLQATNSGADATNVAANFMLSTTALITAGQLNADAMNVVARDDYGNDTAVMPGYENNPWIIFYNNIQANASRNAYIYTGDVTGGEVFYFPGSGGLTVRDAITAEGNDFEWHFNDVQLTSGAGASQYIYKHSNANSGGIELFKSETVPENVTARIVVPSAPLTVTLYPNSAGDSTQLTPITAPTNWECVDEAVTDDNTTYVRNSTTSYLKDLYNLTTSGLGGATSVITAVTLYFRISGIEGDTAYAKPVLKLGGTESIGTEVSQAGATYNTFSQSFSRPGGGSWSLSDFASLQAGVLLKATIAQARCTQVYVVITYTTETYTDLTVTGADTDTSHDFTLSLAGGTLSFQMDSEAPETTAFVGSIPNSTSDVTLLEGDACLYAESVTYTQGGTVRGQWAWEYPDEMDSTLTNGTGAASGSPITLALGANTVTVTSAGTFVISNAFGWHVKAVSGGATVTGSPKYCPSPTTRGTTQETTITVTGTGTITVTVERVLTDQSANSYDAAATFRTTSSDADVSTLLTSFKSTSEAAPEQSLISDWPEMITDVPEEPSSMYTEETQPGIFFAPLLHAIWPDSIPESLFWYNFAFSTIIGAGILTFYLMASKGQNGLLLKIIVMLAIMIFWSVPGPNIYGMYVSIYFIFWSFGVLVLSRNYGW